MIERRCGRRRRRRMRRVKGDHNLFELLLLQRDVFGDEDFVAGFEGRHFGL